MKDRIVLKQLKSKKQLRKVSFRKVVSAGFTSDDERYFTITFDCGEGTMQDLTIAFETRTPRAFISDIYTE